MLITRGMRRHNMLNQNYLGHCLCKQVQFSVHGDVRDLCCCHCESCRRAAGAPFVAWGTVDVDKLVITKGHLAIVNSSTNVERGFCSNCGASLTYQHISRNHEIDFTLASLDNPAVLAPRYHIWV